MNLTDVSDILFRRKCRRDMNTENVWGYSDISKVVNNSLIENKPLIFVTGHYIS